MSAVSPGLARIKLAMLGYEAATRLRLRRYGKPPLS